MSNSKEGRLKKLLPKKASDFVLVALMIIFAAMAVFGGIKLGAEQKEYSVGTNTYDILASSVYIEQITTPDEAEAPPPKEDLPPAKIDFNALKNINSQAVGWITGCEGTVNYPVVRGEDNDYYLNHLIDGKANKNGSIFMDYRNSADFSDKNTFIYGHNMKNGKMFGELAKYGKKGYFEKNPSFTLMTPEGNYLLEVFSGYVTSGTSETYEFGFEGEQDFTEYIQRAYSLSDFNSPVRLTTEDRIVTLSTCTYDYEDARYVIHCKLTPIEE